MSNLCKPGNKNIYNSSHRASSSKECVTFTKKRYISKCNMTINKSNGNEQSTIINPVIESEPNNSKLSETPSRLRNHSCKNNAAIKGKVVNQNMCCIK